MVLPSAKNDNTSAKGSSELKLLRGWSEICDNAAHDNGAVLGFLKMAKAQEYILLTTEEEYIK